MATLPSSAHSTLKSRYARFETERQPYLDRARECAKLTIPTLYPETGSSSSSRFKTPWQGLGARGLNNLASKLLLTTLPANTSFFRYTVDDVTLLKLTKKEGMRAAVEEALASMERSVSAEIETSNIRVVWHEALKHYLLGNVLVHCVDSGDIKFFRLDQYVVKRDPMGNPLEIITKECLSIMELPDDVRAQVQVEDGKADSPEDIADLYTCIKRTFTQWDIWQEINGVEVPDSRGTYPLDICPWFALRGTVVAGEDYGRGYIESCLGDLKSLEGLTKAMVQGSAAAAKVLFLTKPNSTTRLKDVANAESGAFIAGNAEDVTVLQLNKAQDFRVALDGTKELTASLSYAFMLNSAIQRNGERVTAEEIRYMANELDTSLGGLYSNLSREFQLPLLKVKMHQMEKGKRLPAMPKGKIKPLITTGVEAIGRGNDLNKMDALLKALQPLGPEVIAQSLNIDDYIKRMGASLGIDMKGLVYTAEEKAAKQQQEMQMQMMQQLGPNAINQLGGIAKEGMANQAASEVPPTE